MSSVHPQRPAPGRRRRGLAIGALALGLAGTSAACGVSNSNSDSEDGDAGDTVRIVLPQEPPTLEPCEASLTSTGVVVRSNITEPLVERDPTSGELNPLLATEWEQTSDTEWTFKLQDGVKFSDGTAFDADAAAYSIERAVNSELGCNVEGYVFGDVDLVVKAVDPTTVTVTTPEAGPDPPAAHLLRGDGADVDQRHREGPRARRHRPVQDRQLGGRPEADPRRRTATTGATRPPSAPRRTSGGPRAACAQP